MVAATSLDRQSVRQQSWRAACFPTHIWTAANSTAASGCLRARTRP